MRMETLLRGINDLGKNIYLITHFKEFLFLF